MLKELIKEFEDIRDGNFPDTMKAINIIAYLPDILTALRAAEELRSDLREWSFGNGFNTHSTFDEIIARFDEALK